MFREVTVALPPLIADYDVLFDSATATTLEAATQEISGLDLQYGPELAALGMLLLRTESVASSKIEAIEASMDDYARALHGMNSNSSAAAMAAATGALDTLIGDTLHGHDINLPAILSAHRMLMTGDTAEAGYAGRLRDMQNWIGGSNHSPRDAVYVPPPPDTVPMYLDDLLSFANRSDIPTLAQAAIAHAQFESIHPFTDGNGRIGRALINAILRRRGATTEVVVPLASSLVAQRDHYFDLLNAYRDGDITPLISTFAQAATIAAAESRFTAQRLRDIPEQWRDAVGPLRAGSAVALLLPALPTQPILSAEDACALFDIPRSSVFTAIERLHAAGVLRPLTTRKRNQIWAADAILAEVDDLGHRIAMATR